MSIAEIQAKLKAPKGQFNSFGKYYYRSCEDIVEAVKPLLKEYGYHLNMTDDVIAVGDRVYIKATASIMDGDKIIQSASAAAREAETKKGMDDSQITGTASSYARKYALNGLLAIDDTKDADTDEHQAKTSQAGKADDKPWYNDFDKHKATMIDKIENGQSAQEIVNNLRKNFKVSKEVEQKIKSLETQGEG